MGLAVNGRTITAAAAIMMVVFAGFIPTTDRTVKMIGLGMAVAIAIDSLIIVPCWCRQSCTSSDAATGSCPQRWIGTYRTSMSKAKSPIMGHGSTSYLQCADRFQTSQEGCSAATMCSTALMSDRWVSA
jgi:hypothetical protein